MAKAKYGALLFGKGGIDNVYDNDFVLEKGTKTVGTYDDGSNLREMIWVGKGYAYDGDTFTKGTVEKIIFAENDGTRYLTISGLDIKATALAEFIATESLEDTLEFVLQGRDTVKGSASQDDVFGYGGRDVLNGLGGDDHIWCGEGRDRLTGGRGEDWFEFRPGIGRDTITDFDADPTGGQDLISAGGIPDYDISMKNGNAVLDFGDGDILVLLGVHKNQIDITDFTQPV